MNEFFRAMHAGKQSTKTVSPLLFRRFRYEPGELAQHPFVGRCQPSRCVERPRDLKRTREVSARFVRRAIRARTRDGTAGA
jgi:hypothetical protein